jgi:hypothetical protein
MLAEIAAVTDDDLAESLVEKVRAYNPGEADTILATLRVRQSRMEEAADALERAFARFRVDPWAMTAFKNKALILADRVAPGPALARRMVDALALPFANLSVDESRLFARAALSMRLVDAHACVAPLAALQQKALWNETFLRLRRDCYRANGDSRLAAASKDLLEFLAHEPPSLPPLDAAASSQP